MTDYELTGNKIVETKEPEQFNAFRSLNTIEEHLKMLTETDRKLPVVDFGHSINCIYEEVYALRAYIIVVGKS